MDDNRGLDSFRYTALTLRRWVKEDSKPSLRIHPSHRVSHTDVSCRLSTVAMLKEFLWNLAAVNPTSCGCAPAGSIDLVME